MNFEIMKESLPLLLAGAGITVEITAASVGLGLAIGVVVSLIRLCGIRLCAFWATFMSPFSGGLLSWSRSFWCILLAGPDPSSGGRLCTAISACSINSGAYVAEIFRGGIESIDKGRWKPAGAWV